MQEKCKPSDMLLMSNPPQNKCKICGQTWYVGKEAPICITQEKVSDWEIQFEKEFPIFNKEFGTHSIKTGRTNLVINKAETKKIKDFIKSILTQREKEIRNEYLEAIARETATSYGLGYEQAEKELKEELVKKIEEACKKIEASKENNKFQLSHYVYRQVGFNQGLDQATNIIKELVNN